jgi:signal transduction histidine kinase
VARINRHSGDLQRLTDRMLQFHALDTGEREPEPVPLGLARVVATVVDRTAYVTRSHDVIWEVEPALTALADVGMVEAALEALIDNAARYTPASTRIRIAAGTLGEHAQLRVSDDGPGVPEDALEDLRVAFHRAGDVLTRPTRGIGLGLATVERIARLHGSELELRNRAGGGFVASFTLPRLTSEDRIAGRRLHASEVIHLGDARPTGHPTR